MTMNIEHDLDGVNTLASPAMGHWGAFTGSPSTFSSLFFSSL